MSKVIKKYRKVLGPSQFAAILGLDPFLTKEKLQSEIENGYIPSGNFATQHGIDHEAIALYYYKKIYNTTITKPEFVMDTKHNKIGGICDGLIDINNGIEIKCHVSEKNLIKNLYNTHLLQMAGYMYLYNRSQWTLMSCTFKNDHTLSRYKLFIVKWDDVKDKWEKEWYPQIVNFANNVKWQTNERKN